jgi:hypothetical protein
MVEQLLQRGVLNNGRVLDYAFGLIHGSYRGAPAISHGGGDAGYRAHFLRFPDQDLSIACLCNLAEIDPFELGRRIADLYLASEPAMPIGSTKKDDAVVAMPPGELAKLAGFYWHAPGAWGWRIDFTEDRLWVFFGKDDRAEVLPLSAGRFRAAGRPIELEFGHNETDGGRTMVVRYEGRSEEWGLHEALEFKPAPEQLALYAGIYRCEELEPAYRIHILHEALFLTRFKHRPAELTPLIQDYFSSPTGSLHFLRDPFQRVTAFVLNARGIKGMTFKKTEAAVDERHSG